jgi:hypothetical protein
MPQRHQGTKWHKVLIYNNISFIESSCPGAFVADKDLDYLNDYEKRSANENAYATPPHVYEYVHGSGSC